MKIEETLSIEILEVVEVEEDYPGQQDDYRLQRLREGLTSFVRRFAVEHTESPGEEAVLILGVARDIFESVNSAAAMRLLRERLLRKTSPLERNLHRKEGAMESDDLPRTLEELCQWIEDHAETIAVREQVDGKWGAHYLSTLPARRAIHHALQFVRQGRTPIYVRPSSPPEEKPGPLG